MAKGSGIGIILVVLAGIAAAFYYLKGRISSDSGQGETEISGGVPEEEGLMRRIFTRTPEEHEQKEDTREHKAEIRAQTEGGLEDFIFGTDATVAEASDWREHEQKVETRQHKHDLKEGKYDARARRKSNKKLAKAEAKRKRRAERSAKWSGRRKGLVRTAKAVHGVYTKGRKARRASRRKAVTRTKARITRTTKRVVAKGKATRGRLRSARKKVTGRWKKTVGKIRKPKTKKRTSLRSRLKKRVKSATKKRRFFRRK